MTFIHYTFSHPISYIGIGWFQNFYEKSEKLLNNAQIFRDQVILSIFIFSLKNNKNFILKSKNFVD